MLPFADIRVIAIEQFGAGPWGTMQLADLGAEVIKIEDVSVGGDVGRHVPPFGVDGTSLFFETFNRHKSSVSLDLRNPAGREVFERLVLNTDAVFSNLRGDGPARLGIRYEDLAEINPRIVCVSLSGFGSTGPRATEGAYDLTIQALAGWMSVTGGPGEPPTKSGLSLVDFSGGYVAAIALIAGVWQARREGVGRGIDLSLFETALALLTYMATWTASRGWKAQRLTASSHQTIVPFQVFPSADGLLVVACAKDTLW
ncbi:MAG: CaiB/BaiF CoA transferase family protein, partial [Ilumatobacteraceae bacterium]